MDENPYLNVTGRRFEMKGKGAPRETVSGVLGKTKYDPYMKSLGGLVSDTKLMGPMPKVAVSNKDVMNTDRKIIGPAPKTHVSGMHYGQILFSGPYMGDLGKRL